MAIHLVTYLVLLPTARTLGMDELAFIIIITSSTFGRGSVFTTVCMSVTGIILKVRDGFWWHLGNCCILDQWRVCYWMLESIQNTLRMFCRTVLSPAVDWWESEIEKTSCGAVHKKLGWRTCQWRHVSFTVAWQRYALYWVPSSLLCTYYNMYISAFHESV